MANTLCFPPSRLEYQTNEDEKKSRFTKIFQGDYDIYFPKSNDI